MHLLVYVMAWALPATQLSHVVQIDYHMSHGNKVFELFIHECLEGVTVDESPRKEERSEDENEEKEDESCVCCL